MRDVASRWLTQAGDPQGWQYLIWMVFETKAELTTTWIHPFLIRLGYGSSCRSLRSPAHGRVFAWCGAQLQRRKATEPLRTPQIAMTNRSCHGQLDTPF